MTATLSGNRQLRPAGSDGGTIFPRAAENVPTGSLLAGDSPRFNGQDADHIQALATAGVTFPPILVHRQTMRVIDGMHRLRVALLKGQKSVQARFFDGDEDEAFVMAVQANTSHGLTLTLAEREAAASRIIASYPNRSDRWVAEVTKLAAGTVKRLRQQLAGEDHGAWARVGKDGRVRPLNSADGRRVASLMIAKSPDASLRSIARLAGISPTTVRDVRERLRRGDDPVPPPRSGVRSPPATAAAISLTPAEDTRHGSAPGTTRDRTWLLDNLRKDPALRYTDAGRALLRWLDTKASGPGRWQDLLATAPPHCAYLVAGLARQCAGEWLELAAQVERRLGTMA